MVGFSPLFTNCPEEVFSETGLPVLRLIGSLYEDTDRSRVYVRAAVLLPSKGQGIPAARPWATSPHYSLNFREMDSRKPGELAEEKGRVSNSPCLFSLPPTIQPLVIS